MNLASDERPKEREECTIHSCTNEIRGYTVLEVSYTLAVLAIPTSRQTLLVLSLGFADIENLFYLQLKGKAVVLLFT